MKIIASKGSILGGIQHYYNTQLMLGKIVRSGEVLLCGTCMDARGLRADEIIEGALRGTLAQLTDWTVEADKVLVF
jgi:uncharacterized protein involved in oxidation of intracellular sulfur